MRLEAPPGGVFRGLALSASRPVRHSLSSRSACGLPVATGVRPDGWTEPSFQPIRAGEDPLRDRPLREGDEPAVRRTQPTPCRSRIHQGDYSIADIAAYPWIVPYERQGQKLEDFPHLKRWFETIRRRPATVRAYDKAMQINTQPVVTEESKRILFGQTAAAA